MNYQRIYNELIERAKGRELDVYTELHHIIPRCMGGEDKLSNLVELTYREHFIAHWLLHRIHPNSKELAYAFTAMKMDKHGNRTTSKWTPSSRQLEELKLAYIQGRTGSSHSKETRKKISEGNKGNVSHNKGKKAPRRVKQKMSEAKLGWNRPDEDKIKISEGKKKWYKNNPHPNLGKTYTTTNWDRTEEGIQKRIERVKELYDKGTPITQITTVVSVSRQAIYNWIKEYNWHR